jgi:hypothetical protein
VGLFLFGGRAKKGGGVPRISRNENSSRIVSMGLQQNCRCGISGR